VACVVPLVDGVRQTRAVLWSATRGTVQLLAVGLLLGAVFRAPLAVLPLLAVMVTAATATVAPRLAGLPAPGRWQRPAAAAAAVTSGAALTGTVIFATGALPLGATMRQATADLVAVAVAEALVPALDQTRTTGLVTLPGAFVGALFGGASPLAAARFQLVVLVGLLAAESVATVVLLRLLANLPFLPAESR
jgi:putative ABC transport system permease protein